MASPPKKGKKAHKTTTATTTGSGKGKKVFKKKRLGGTSLGAKKKGSSPSEIRKQRQKAAIRKANDAGKTGVFFAQSSQYRNNKVAEWKSAVNNIGCAGTEIGYSNPASKRRGASGKNNAKRGRAGAWLCHIDSQIMFKERRYSNQHNEFRLFIEGAEVTKYVEGAVSWTYESTNGMNSLRFVLNNRDDAFIIMPENICSGPNTKSGWRIDNNVLHGRSYIPQRYNSRVLDETAKYVIYNNKLRYVHPGHGAKPAIDENTGMWLFPLNPYSCVIDKHDPVRLFIRLPHVYGVSSRSKKQTRDAWMPVFTGFVRDYSWDDDPVQGSRYVNVTCYDHRGILERMRVSIPGIGNANSGGDSAGSGQKNEKQTKALDNKKNQSNTPLPIDEYFLKLARKVGRAYAQHLSKNFSHPAPFIRTNDPFRFMQVGNDGAYDHRYGAPTTGAQARGIGLLDVLKKLYKDLSTLELFKADCGVKKTSGGLVSSMNPDCAAKVWDKVNKKLEVDAARVCAAIGEILRASTYLYFLNGSKWWLYIVAKRDNGIPDVQVHHKGYDGPSESKISYAEGVQRIAAGATNIALGKHGKKAIVTNYEKTPANEILSAYLNVYNNVGGITGLSQDSTAYLHARESAYMTPVNFLGILEGTHVHLSGGVNFTSGETVSRAEAILWFEIYNMLYQQKKDKLVKAYPNPSADEKNHIAVATEVFNVINEQRNKLIKPLYQADMKAKAIMSKNEYLKFRFPNETGIILEGSKQGDNTRVFSSTSFNYTGMIRKLLLDAPKVHVDHSWKTIFNRKPDFFAKDESKLRKYIKANYKKLYKITKDRVAVVDKMDKTIGADINRYKAIITYYGTSLGDPHGRTDAWTHSAAAKKAIGRKIEPTPLPRVFAEVKKLRKQVKNYDNKYWQGFQKSIRATRSDDLVKKQTQALEEARGNTGVKATAVGDIYSAYVAFDKKSAGLYADLMTANNGQAHPLMGKSFEEAVEYLCCTNTEINRGRIENVNGYKKGALDQWNRVVLFGIIQRPLTFHEVSVIGASTVRDTGSIFSPYKVFYHMMRPADGTGAATIVQKNTSNTAALSRKGAPSFSTRKVLLDQISEALDFQFFCSGMGDLIFEMPNYNAMPRDFGHVFEGAYVIAKDWIKSSVSEEGREVPTGWLVTGLENDKLTERSTASDISKNIFRKNSIICTTLAQRIGVRAEHINIKIPGIGAPTSGAALDQMMTYAAFYIQRQLGRAHTFTVKQPFRPYITINRPIYLVPRQRIGLPISVTHTLNPPDGTCTTETNMAYTRWLFRDGTFRFIGGGTRQPVSYTSFYIGVPNYELKEGTLNATANNSVVGSASRNSAATMAKRVRASNVFASAVNSTFDIGATSAISRIPVAPSGKVTEHTDWAASGFKTQTTTSKKKAAKNKADNGSGDAFAAFHNPWKYAHKKHSPWRQWGYFRKYLGDRSKYTSVSNLDAYHYAMQGFKKSSRRHDFYHAGVDILCPHGVKMLTPVNITKARYLHGVGPYWRDAHKIKPVTSAEFGIMSRYRQVFYKGSLIALKDAFRVGADFAGERGLMTTPVSAKQWDNFIAITGGGTRLQNMQIYRTHKGGGVLSTLGRVALPSDPNGATIPCVLQYVHMDGPILVGNKYFGVDIRHGNPLVARAGNPVSAVGLGMTKDAHVHFNMYLGADTKNQAEKKILDLTINANKEYLTKQQLALATGLPYDALDTKNIRDQKIWNQPAAKYWQTNLFRGRTLGWQRVKAERKKRKKSVVTVRDAVEFMRKRKVWRNATVPTKGAGGYAGRWLPTNALLFFKTYQIIDFSDKRARNFGPLRDNAELKVTIRQWAQGSAVGSTGSVGYRPMALQYNPDSITWCGSANARVKAGKVTKKRKLTAKSKQKTASKPQDKKKNEAKTKKHLAKSSAAAKAQKKTAKGDRSKVHKQVAREAKQVRKARNRALHRHPVSATGKPSEPLTGN